MNYDHNKEKQLAHSAKDKDTTLQRKEMLPFEELVKRDRELVQRIVSDDIFAYKFFHNKCKPLLSGIIHTIYGNVADYEELVNELYLLLKKPNAEGDYWYALKTFDFRTSLFDWIKTVAVRHFYTPSCDIFTIPETLIDSGLAEEMFSKLNKAVYRKYLCFKHLDNLSDDQIADKLSIERSQVPTLSRKVIRQLKSIIENEYPEYLSILFQKSDVHEVDINDKDIVATENDSRTQDSHMDVFQYLDAMPNKYYRRVIEALFLDDISPEALAQEMGTKVSNIYNIKSRGLDQLRDVALYSNEIHNLEKYINLISDDRKRAILISIFIERRDYEVVCSELKITEVQFKKIKKDAIREIKQLIFRAKK